MTLSPQNDMKFRCLAIALLLVATSGRLLAQAAPEPTKSTNAAPQESSAERFRFDGGYLHEFIKKLGDAFGTNIVQLIDVRSELSDTVRVPKMRSHNELRSVLRLYNEVSSEGDGFLGKWIYAPALGLGGNPPPPVDTIVFVPPKPAADADAIQVRAFSTRSLTDDHIKRIREIVEEESLRLERDIQIGRLPAQNANVAHGRLNFHENSRLLLAVGGKTYVAMVETVVEALTKNLRPADRP